MSNALSAKEPSMDEILASIRRIIESGEERQNQTPSRSLTAEAASDSGPTMLLSAANTRGTPRVPLPASDAEMEPASDMAQPVGAARSESLRETVESTGDVLQRLRRASATEARAPETVADTVPAPVEGSVASEIPGAFKVQEDLETASIAPIVSPASPSDRFDAVQFDGEFNEQDFAAELLETVGLIRSEEVSFQEALAQSLSGETLERKEVASAFETPKGPATDPLGLGIVTEEPQRSSILVSPEASEQIASSFEDLARVVREEHLRVMDQTIDQMLRPMLQEWLDDNLPGIVERLVREEIERVARGRR